MHDGKENLRLASEIDRLVFGLLRKAARPRTTGPTIHRKFTPRLDGKISPSAANIFDLSLLAATSEAPPWFVSKL